MSTALEVRRPTTVVPAQEWSLMSQQADALARSDIIPRAYQRKPANVLVAALTGRHYGWDVLTAMRNGHVIEGSWGMKPEAMLGLVRQAGHSVKGDMNADGATVVGTRADTGDSMTISFTLDDARRANLLGKGTWKQYPQMMCYWRAVGILCRVLFSDLTAGVHSAEELGAEIDEDGGVIDVGEVTMGEVEPMPLSPETLLAFDKACRDHGLVPADVLGATFPDGMPDPLTDEHLPMMRDTFKRMVEQTVVEHSPTDPPTTVEVRPATRAQVGKIKGEYKRIGYEDRDRQLLNTSAALGRDVGSHNDLTYDEAAYILDGLGDVADADATSDSSVRGSD